MSDTAAAAPSSSAPASSNTAAPTNSNPAAPAPKTEAAPATPPAEKKTPSAEASEAAKTLAKHKLKLKVKGQEMEREFTDDELTLHVQKGLGADAAFQQAAAERKRLEELLNQGRADPVTAAKELWGLDIEAYVQDRLGKQLAEDLRKQRMTPEEQMQAQYEAKIKAMEEEATKAKQALEARETAEIEQKAFQELETSFLSALQAEGLPKSYDALGEMARVQKLADSHGLQLTPAQLAVEVRNRLEARQEKLHKSVMGGLQGEALLNHLGPDIVKEVIRAKLAMQQAAVTPKPSAPVKREQPKPEKKETLTPSQFYKKHTLGI